MNETPLDTWKQGKTRFSRGQNASEYIPTWTVGQAQIAPNDARKYADEGYQKNSLIYSVIREKATSFAALNPQVVRNGKVSAHRMVDLLNNPNGHQDGQDFGELLMTQYEAAGNAYVQKVRASNDSKRRSEFATFPVQELRLVRPDYVTIQPGARPELDVYLVTVGGKIVERIPRADMIHIHEPNLTNDFYGLPKIALLTREGDIDIAMSDFELAFFRNAGVPMGLLKIKGRTSETEITEVKQRFRAAYNGVRKWFDLLVLNSDQAEYTPMGMKQADMEMDGSRFHSESRICSVFGVPPIIVGARVSMQGQGGTYEDAEHAFWSETMVPATMRFARAWQKFLLPEFATRADANAEVTYDFSQVRALQEDRSRKLREVVRLVLTGAFTVNQALVAVGMTAIPDGDFYIRNGNQVVVMADGTMIPMAPNSGGPNLDNPLEGAAGLQLEQVLRKAGSIG